MTGSYINETLEQQGHIKNVEKGLISTMGKLDDIERQMEEHRKKLKIYTITCNGVKETNKERNKGNAEAGKVIFF